jgi:hypothetical protein
MANMILQMTVDPETHGEYTELKEQLRLSHSGMR